jgi:hypothetical protein
MEIEQFQYKGTIPEYWKCKELYKYSSNKKEIIDINNCKYNNEQEERYYKWEQIN